MPRTVQLNSPSLPFSIKDMIVTMDQPKKDWNPREKLTNTHIGQLKLLSTELAFLLDFQEKKRKYGDDETVLVYAGAAPGQHLKAIRYLFPRLQTHLYDPAPFVIHNSSTVHIHNDFFTDETAEEWSNDDGVLFISDVRSRTSGLDRTSFEDEVHHNMMMQKRWVEIMKPESFSLKFRIPYTVIEGGLTYDYLGGTLIYQPYSKADSMEMRLIGHYNNDDGTIPYDSVSLEKILFYHNSCVRADKHRYVNILTGDKRDYPKSSGYFRDYDSSYYLYTVSRYLEDYPDVVDETDVLSLANKLLSITYGAKFNLADRHYRL